MYVHALQEDDKTRRNALAAHLTAAGASTANSQPLTKRKRARRRVFVAGAAAATSSLYTPGGIAGPSPFAILALATFQRLELGRVWLAAYCRLRAAGPPLCIEQDIGPVRGSAFAAALTPVSAHRLQPTGSLLLWFAVEERERGGAARGDGHTREMRVTRVCTSSGSGLRPAHTAAAAAHAR
jgi:hypothetical protein